MSEDTSKSVGKSDDNKGETRQKTPEEIEEIRRQNLDKGKWQPGQSGNPAGRPKGAKTGLRARLVRELEKAPHRDELEILEAKGIKLENCDNAELIAMVVARAAKKGNMKAVKIIADQTEVPMPKKFEMTGDFIVNLPPEDAGLL